MEEFQRGVELVPSEPVTAERAQVLAGLAQVLMLTGQLAEAQATAEQALEAAIEVGARQVEGHARNTLGTVLSNRGDLSGVDEVRRALPIALELGKPDDIGRAYVNLTHVLGEAGRWDELLAVAPEALTTTRRLGIDRTHGIYVEANVSEGLIAVGRWDDASAAVRSLAARLPTGHWEYFAISVLDADRGDADAVRSAMARAGRIPEHDTAVLQGLAAAFEAQVALAVWERRPADVRPLVEEAVRRIPPRMLGWKVAPILWRATWAEADLAQVARARRDDAALAAAREAADRWLAIFDQVADGAAQLEGAVLPTVGFFGYRTLAIAERRRLDGTDAPVDWMDAVSELDAVGIVFPGACARFRAGEALLRAGDRQAADAVVQEAATVARRLGARPLLELIEQLAARGRLGVERPDDPATGDDGLGLSAREREVLVLVAEGRTNREIAEALFISPKTASVHVSNILAKLGVSGRVEAAAVAHRVGLAG